MTCSSCTPLISPGDHFFVAGHRAMAGSVICRALQAGSYHNILTATRSELDLEDASAVTARCETQKPDGTPNKPLDISGIAP